jgi:hypothetical protein
MPRAKIETAFLGSYTVAALDAAPDAEAAWLVHALCGWILRDELPKEVPPSYASAWAVVRSESETIHERMKESADARTEAARIAAEARWNANASERIRKNANASERIPTECVTMLEREKEKEKENIIRNESETERAGKPASASDSASVKIDLDFFDWYVRPDRELVPAALALIGEQGNARMRGRLGKAKRVLGLAAFREELATFAAELRAGEVPANKGATLNARLSAREAVGV